MSRKAPKLLSALAAAGIIGASLAFSPLSHAFNFGDMMNPGKWMGGDRDRYDDDYYDDGPYGGGPYGGGPYGGGPYGGGPYGPGPYGAPYGGGYGPGPYGPPGFRGAPPPAPAAAPAAKAPSAPATRNSEIDALKQRIEELESQQRPAPPPSGSSDWGSPPPPSSSDWGSAPAFRPMGKY